MRIQGSTQNDFMSMSCTTHPSFIAATKRAAASYPPAKACHCGTSGQADSQGTEPEARAAGLACESRFRASVEINVRGPMDFDQFSQIRIDRIAHFRPLRIGIGKDIARKAAAENRPEQPDATGILLDQAEHRKILDRDVAHALRRRVLGGVPDDEVFERHLGIVKNPNRGSSLA